MNNGIKWWNKWKVQEMGQGRQQTYMAKPRPAGQTKRKDGNAQAVEAGQVSQEDYRNAVWLCKDKVRKARVQLELNLVYWVCITRSW